MFCQKIKQTGDFQKLKIMIYLLILVHDHQKHNLKFPDMGKGENAN